MVQFTLVIIALNLIAMALVARYRGRAKMISTAVAALSLVLSVWMIVQFAISGNPSAGLYIPYLNIGVSFGLTGISAVLLLMAEIVILASAASGNTEKAGFAASAALLSLFQIAAVGVFTSLNLLLFFIFWDIGVIALFLMINVLGSERRHAASVNFILYELFASAMLLLGIILLYSYLPAHSLNIGYIASAAGSLPQNIKVLVLVSLFLAFMTNMAIFPMHFWLPDAYAEASTQGSMLLGGVLTKFGGYGMIILFTLSGIASGYSSYIAALAIGSTIYAVLMLIRQKELKRIIAYSAMLEMGIIMVAVAAANSTATYGAVYGMFAQGISIALAFLAVGVIKRLFDETNVDRIRDILSGAKSAAYSFALAALSIFGFPLTAGFIAEILIFFGAVQAFGLYGLLPLVGILIMAGYFYSVISRSILSKSRPTKASGSPMLSERLGFYGLSIAVIVFGILPFLIIGLLKL
jgi:NADH-quinone oxidoreductase subunit M